MVGLKQLDSIHGMQAAEVEKYLTSVLVQSVEPLLFASPKLQSFSTAFSKAVLKQILVNVFLLAPIKLGENRKREI